MANPVVVEWPIESGENETQVHTHSTCEPTYSKYDFRGQSVALVNQHHRRILLIYNYIHEQGGHNLTKQYLRCKTDAWLVQHEESKELRIASRKCNQRWCPMCQKTKRWIITNSVSEWVQKTQYPKFITLTLKSSTSSLEFQVKRLYESFKVLRRKKIWKQSVRGGVWFFQLTMNKDTGLWHPHIHILVESDYIPRKKLSDEWLKVTCDSMIIDIRKVADPEKAAEYVARYATVPGEVLKCSVKQGAAMVIGLKGIRMCGAFGSAKGLALRPKSSPEFAKWRKVMSYCAFVVGASLDPYIQAVAEAFRDGKPFEGDIWGLYDTPDMPPECTRFKPESMQQLLFEYDECYYLTGTC